MMTLRDLLFLKTTRGPLSVKAHPADAVQKVGTQGRAKTMLGDSDALLAAYRRNEIVFACIEVKRLALQDPRLIVEERQPDGTYKEVQGHPLRRLWMRPAAHHDEASFLGLANASMDIVGLFVAEKVKSKSGALVGLNPLNPAKLRPYVDTNRTQIGWTWRDGTKQVDFLYADLLIRESDWASEAPLKVALGSTDADIAQTDFIRAFFDNGAQPGGILTSDQMLDLERSEELRSRWRALFGRRGRQHDVAVLGKGTTYQKTGSGLDELDSESIRSLTESRICMVFGVPPLIVYAYVGLLRATYSNLKEAWANFWDAKLSPDLKAWRSWLTWNLLVEFEGEERVHSEQVRLRWDLTQVAALQDDVDQVHGRAERAFRAGGITLNEYRAHLGAVPDPTGDYYLRSLALLPTPLGAPPTDAPKQLPRQRETKAAPRRLERRLQAALETYLTDQYEQAARAILEAA